MNRLCSATLYIRTMNEGSPLKPEEIDALLKLIDDPDDQIYTQVRDQIVSLGASVIPKLELFWEDQEPGDVFQRRIEDIIHEIQFSSVEQSLKDWHESGAESLLEGALIINRYQYPEVDDTEIRETIARIRQDIWLELNDNLTSFEQVRVMNEIIFNVHGFKGNKKNYHAPQNSYLSHVLESKRGNPLSLSMLYIILAESLDVPIFGVNLPHHFILAYEDRFNIYRETDTANKERKVLFYMDAFSKGTLLNRAEIVRFLKRQKLEPKPEYFMPCDNSVMMVRCIHNLIFAYQHAGEEAKIEELKKLLAIFSAA